MAHTRSAYTLPGNIAYMLGRLWSDCRIVIFYAALEIVCGVLSPFFAIYLPKLALGELMAGADARRLLFSMGGFTLLMALTQFGGFYATTKYWIHNASRTLYMIDVQQRMYTCDYALLESAEGQARHSRAMGSLMGGDWSCVSRMISSLQALAVAVLGFALYSTVLTMLHPLTVVLLLITALIHFAAQRSARLYEEKCKSLIAPYDNKIRYLEIKSEDARMGKDVRMYGMRAWLTSTWHALIDAKMRIVERTCHRQLFAALVGAATVLLRDGAAYAYLIYAVSRGQVSVADFLLYFGAIAGFAGFVSTIIGQSDTLFAGSLQMNDLRGYLDACDEPEPSSPAEPLPPDQPPEIRFEDVCFGYETDKPILDHFSLTIRAGEKLALVGMNGAGKTTLVKLLCGFYHPQSGRILISGVDAARMRKADRFALFSAVFQDFPVFPFTIAQNIALKENIDEARALRCAKDAGLGEFMETLPRGLDTPLHTDVHPEGTNLSGGQAQKLALARALYKDAPVLLLDEPTAALDPIAESEVYAQYHALAQGKTSLFISHRLASTRFCDRILYIENGRVFEDGTHDTLMARGGQYARMFEVQSHYYRKDAPARAREEGVSHA